jgi:hypothetical protein
MMILSNQTLHIKICDLRGKEIKLIEDIEKRKIKIIGIADIRFLCRGRKQQHKGYILIYSGAKKKNELNMEKNS